MRINNILAIVGQSVINCFISSPSVILYFTGIFLLSVRPTSVSAYLCGQY